VEEGEQWRHYNFREERRRKLTGFETLLTEIARSSARYTFETGQSVGK
jgi:hypothetical protein